MVALPCVSLWLELDAHGPGGPLQKTGRPPTGGRPGGFSLQSLPGLGPQLQLLCCDGVARLCLGEGRPLLWQGNAPPGTDGVRHSLQQPGVLYQNWPGELRGEHVLPVEALRALLRLIAEA